jgi:hypothetical protein
VAASFEETGEMTADVATSPGATRASLTFSAVQQFLVRPDRCYRVELRGETLRFQRVGSRFDLPLSRIRQATLRMPRRANQVARLVLENDADKPLELTLDDYAHLETVRTVLLPLLGRRARVV